MNRLFADAALTAALLLVGASPAITQQPMGEMTATPGAFIVRGKRTCFSRWGIFAAARR